MAEDVLDLKGLKCPLPALMARKRLERMAAGATLCVLADDPMAFADIPHMCRQHGFEVVSVVREETVTRFVLKRV